MFLKFTDFITKEEVMLAKSSILFIEPSGDGDGVNIYLREPLRLNGYNKKIYLLFAQENFDEIMCKLNRK